jgi:hypothetical protein
MNGAPNRKSVRRAWIVVPKFRFDRLTEYDLDIAVQVGFFDLHRFLF